MTKREPFVPDCFYHLYSHGVGRDDLFRTPDNYRYFLSRYARYAPPVVDTFAYCLMPNHFHVLIRVHPLAVLEPLFGLTQPTTPSLSRAIANQLGRILNAYAKAYNKRFRRRGALFVARMHRKPVTNERYLHAVIRYIHFNPVRHGFVDDPADWPYSSYGVALEEAHLAGSMRETGTH